MNDLDRLFDLADEGDADAIYEIAVRMLEGRGLNKDPQGAYDNFQVLVEAGYENAEVQIARMYYYGYFGDDMVNTGAQMLIDFSEEGNAVASYELGYIYERGISTGVNMDNALALYENAAECGYAPAIAALKRLGVRVQPQNNSYYNSNTSFSNTRTTQTAPPTTQRSVAGSQNPDYMYAEGFKYLYGKGVPQDIKRGEKILNDLAQNGHADANVTLGRYYLGGGLDSIISTKYSDVNIRKHMKSIVDYGASNLAITYFERAIKYGKNDAYLDLAYAYLMRYFYTSGSNDAIRAFSDQNNPAQNRNLLADNMTKAYDTIMTAINKGIKGAKDLRPLFAEIGAEAFSWLAIDELYEYMHFKGNSLSNISLSYDAVDKCVEFLVRNQNFGVCQDYCRHHRQALEELAKEGNIEAQRKLGIILKKGDYLGKDERSGSYWLSMAANSGDAIAQMELAAYYLGFCGGTKNIDYALSLLESAASSGKTECICELARTLAYGLGSQRDSYDLPRAIALYEAECQRGSAQAMYELANLNRDPRTQRMSRKSSEQLYRMASDRGYKKAKRKLSEVYNYSYSREDLSRWFDEDMRHDVLHSSYCNSCGSTLHHYTKRFLGQFYYQCPVCGARHS